MNQCLRDACRESKMARCVEFIDCGYGNDYRNFWRDPTWDQWKNNSDAVACFTNGGFDYGIYEQAVNLTTEGSVVTRYVYSLFWGFQVSLPSLHDCGCMICIFLISAELKYEICITCSSGL